jgi:hypothetical protein
VRTAVRNIAVLVAVAALSLPSEPARAQNSTAGALLGGFVGALIGELVGHHIALQSDVREQEMLDAVRRTSEDEAALKGLATALEEYAVDHNGTYPATLAALGPPYLSRQPWIPESNPPAMYRYENPAARSQWGTWDIADNGAFDPTLHDLRAPNGSICTHETCKFIVYAQSQGLVGAPADYAAEDP